MPYMLIWINLATFFLGIKKRDKTWNQGKNAQKRQKFCSGMQNF